MGAGDGDRGRDRDHGKLKSIRRKSFVEAFGIEEGEEREREDDDDDFSPSSLNLDDSELFARGLLRGDSSFDPSLARSLTVRDLEASDDEEADASPPLRRKDSPGGSDPSPPKNWAGGSRRRSAKNRRIRRAAAALSESRRASTGGGSFGAMSSADMSLTSFTSANSFSSGAGDPSKNVAVGNLVFVTDAEMERIMYGDDPDHASSGSGDSGGCKSSSVSSMSSNFSSSLPPSAMLGSGSFSTVRLAWRKTTRPSVRAEVDAGRRGGLLCEDKGELVAVKIMEKSLLKKMKTMRRGPNNRMTVLTAFDNIEREIATMKRLRHPNLVRLFEAIDCVESDRLHMVLEYVSLGEILSHVEGTNRYTRTRYRRKVKGLNEKGHFDEKHAALYFVDIMHGLAYLHRNRICHRDLKPENILLDASGIAKISDFGVAHIFDEERARESYMLNALDDESLDDLLSDGENSSEDEGGGFCMRVDDETAGSTALSKRESDAALAMSSRYNRGTLTKTEGTYCFWSPEMCSTQGGQGFSGYSSDLWAAGVCLYIFTTGLVPFFSLVPHEIFNLIAKGEVRYQGLGLSEELRDLLNKILDKNPASRAGVGECLKHKFCTDAREERVNELGSRFNESKEHIILSKTDVDMAVSVTTGPNNMTFDLIRKVSKRLSAPAVAMNLQNLQSVEGFGEKLKIVESDLPTVVEKSLGAPMATNDSNATDKSKKSNQIAKVSVACKLKNKWLGRKKS